MKPSLAIAVDIGTSGIRAQAIDLSTARIRSTVITLHHPLPGSNVMDHLHFALEIGLDTARAILIEALNTVIETLHIPLDQVQSISVCGNPTQLSIFQESEIQDLAFAGQRKLALLGITDVKRNAVILSAGQIPGLKLAPKCQVIIPPAIRHEVGADALAMIIKSGMLEQNETSLAIDLGTNAEMALYHNGRVFTASTAAGPAIEGQHITCGVLATPGAVCDLEPTPPYHQLKVLGPDMRSVSGQIIDLSYPRVIRFSESQPPIGITGTGTIAMIQQGIAGEHVVLPHITTTDARLHAGEHLFITEKDLQEAGKAIGALRAGQIALCQQAGIDLGDIQTLYMSGASGMYVDIIKARDIGLIPARVQKIYQLGNTALAMARELVINPAALKMVSAVADRLRKSHFRLAVSNVFQKVFILELSHWTEGMPMNLYRKLLKRYGLKDLPEPGNRPEIIRPESCDLGAVGDSGLISLADIEFKISRPVSGCTACRNCLVVCPVDAISLDSRNAPPTIKLTCARCNGVTCRQCENVCPERVLQFNRFFTKAEGPLQ